MIFIVAASTDFLDGQLARRTGSVSDTGRVLDPLADRLLIGATVTALAIRGLLPVTGVALVVVRDIFLVIGYKFLERHGMTIRVSWLGKSYTALLLAAILAVMAGFNPSGVNVGLWFFWIGVAGSMLSGAAYVARGLHMHKAEERG